MITGFEQAQLAGTFFLIAALYSSVGFGGGSSYLAILSLYLRDNVLVVKTTGLLCNLVVAGGGSVLSGRDGHIDWKRFLPIILSGVPMAFIAATVPVKDHTFFISLGSVLLLSGLLLAGQMLINRPVPTEDRGTPWWIDALLGGGIGFVSGLVGIGGGILLSPTLNLLRWSHPRKIAGLASVYILVNSIAILFGQLYSSKFRLEIPLAPMLLLAVFLGGQLGSRIGLKSIRPHAVRGLTGVLVTYIGLKLLLQYSAGISI